jgi:hypothetical protein
MQIFNKGKREFTISTSKLKPSEFIVITSQEGERLVAAYPEDLIAMAIAESKVEPVIEEDNLHDEVDEVNPYKEWAFNDIKAEIKKRDLTTADGKRATLESALIADDNKKAE